MLLKSSSLMIGLMATLLIIWAYQNYKYHHQHNPLITSNVVKYQNYNGDNYRSRSYHEHNLCRVENLQNPGKTIKRRKEKTKQVKVKVKGVT